MFRGTKPSLMDPKSFGVGTVVKEGHDMFLLVAAFTREVCFIDLATFAKASDYIKVEDVNFLSEKEAREVIDSMKRGATFTDYFISTSGLKGVEFSRIVNGLK